MGSLTHSTAEKKNIWDHECVFSIQDGSECQPADQMTINIDF